ncbi:MAG: NAD-dependent epimerase/dehydratase family protein, partial [Gammaproteobacteria bacterium]
MNSLVKRKILVTGSSGFIGSHLVSKFIDLGYEFVVFSRSRKKNSNLILDISCDTDCSDELERVDM